MMSMNLRNICFLKLKNADYRLLLLELVREKY